MLSAMTLLSGDGPSGAPVLARALEVLSVSVGALAAGILLWGIVRSAIVLARLELRGAMGAERSRRELRHLLGYYLLLGLEFLVAADVIQTILTPTLEHVLVLGGVVLIRTVIGFSLHWELGRAEVEDSARASG